MDYRLIVGNVNLTIIKKDIGRLKAEKLNTITMIHSSKLRKAKKQEGEHIKSN